MKQYKEMVRRLEELEDTLELDEAVKSSDGLRDYREIRKELKSEGLL